MGGKSNTRRTHVLVDRHGTVLRELPYTDVRGYSQGRAAVAVGPKGLWGYIDQLGELVIEHRFAAAYPFRDGLARVFLGGTRDGWRVHGGMTGYINPQGAVTIQPRLVVGGDFGDGLAPAVSDGQRLDGYETLLAGTWGFIGKDGEYVLSPRYAWAHEYSEGLACVLDGAYHQYIDTAGKVAIRIEAEPNQSISAGTFSDGVAWVFRHAPSKKFGPPPEAGTVEYIDRTGKTVVQPRAGERFALGDFSEGLALCKDVAAKKHGYIDRTGAFAIAPHYHGGTPFRDGRAIVFDHQGRAQIIDHEGMVLVPFSAGLRGGFPFENGLTIMSR